MTKKTLPIIAALIVVGGGVFYGGMKYAESKSSAKNSASNFRSFQNLSLEERQQRLDQMSRSGRAGNDQFGAGFVNGEIISKDEQSITVKLRDGGSKIIFYSDSTEISKFTAGTSSDFEVGKTVMVNGSANQDGSVAASSIQVRPENNVPDQK